MAVEVNPVHGTHGQGNFAGGIAGESEAGDQRVFEALAEGGMRAMKVAARKLFFEGCGSYGDAVDLDRRPGRGAGDFENFSGSRSHEAEK